MQIIRHPLSVRISLDIGSLGGRATYLRSNGIRGLAVPYRAGGRRRRVRTSCVPKLGRYPTNTPSYATCNVRITTHMVSSRMATSLASRRCRYRPRIFGLTLLTLLVLVFARPPSASAFSLSEFLGDETDLDSSTTLSLPEITELRVRDIKAPTCPNPRLWS